MVITTGVVGQNATPYDEVNKRTGLRSEPKSAFTGNQKARKAKGTTQYRHSGRAQKILV